MHRLERRCGRQRQRIRSLQRELLRMWSQAFPMPPTEVSTDDRGCLVGADAVLSQLSDACFHRLLRLLDDRDQAALALSSSRICERTGAMRLATPLGGRALHCPSPWRGRCGVPAHFARTLPPPPPARRSGQPRRVALLERC